MLIEIQVQSLGKVVSCKFDLLVLLVANPKKNLTKHTKRSSQTYCTK